MKEILKKICLKNRSEEYGDSPVLAKQTGYEKTLAVR
jgi:hypothetical protein